MKFSEVFTSKDNIQLDKRTLVFLRWLAIVGQYLTICVVYFLFKFEFQFFYCSAVILVGVLTNFYLQFGFKKNQLNNFTSTFLLFFDLIQLSVLLYLTGGATNPFTILLIVPAITSSTSIGSIPFLLTRFSITNPSKSIAWIPFRDPPRLPIGVLKPSTIKALLIIFYAKVASNLLDYHQQRNLILVVDQVQSHIVQNR